jgi:hypothetical protein
MMGLLPQQVREMTYLEFFIYIDGFKAANGIDQEKPPSVDEFAEALLEEELAGRA